MLHVRRIDRAEEFAAMRAEWNALLDPVSPWTVFLRHEWIHVWFRAYGAGSRPALLVARVGSALQAVLPLRARRERFAGLSVERLELLANGHSPRADLIARRDTESEAVKAFASFLQEAADWDLAVLPAVGADAALAQLPAHFAPRDHFAQPERCAPYISIHGDWEAFRSSLSRNFQRALRNNRNRIVRRGMPTVELLTEPDPLLKALPDMFEIGARSWQGEAGSGIGSTPENRVFYTGVVRALAPLGAIRLWFLSLGGRRIAFEFHVVGGDVEFGLKTGFDREFESIGPGTFLDQEIVERLFCEGRVREYDLCGDADRYKLRWTDRTRRYERWTLLGHGPRARLLSLWNLDLKPALKQVGALARPRGPHPRHGAAAPDIERGDAA